jgi:hypothetical protein
MMVINFNVFLICFCIVENVECQNFETCVALDKFTRLILFSMLMQDERQYVLMMFIELDKTSLSISQLYSDKTYNEILTSLGIMLLADHCNNLIVDQ